MFRFKLAETRNYTIVRCKRAELEELIKNKNVGEIYTATIDNYEYYVAENCEYYMADVEIAEREINKEKIRELINQIKKELQI